MLAAIGLTQQQIQHFHLLENVHRLAKQANAVGQSREVGRNPNKQTPWAKAEGWVETKTRDCEPVTNNVAFIQTVFGFTEEVYLLP